MASSTPNTSPYCRCCRNKNNLCDIHTVRIKRTSITYVEMIAECVSSNISKSDLLPPWLCIKCSNKLNSFYRFKQMCFKTLENLQQVSKALEKDVEKKVLNNNVEMNVFNNNVEMNVSNNDKEKKVSNNDEEKKVSNNDEEMKVFNNEEEKKVFNNDEENTAFVIKMEEDEQENFDLQTEVFNENIVCEELNIVPCDLVEDEKIKCDPNNVKYEVDVVDTYLYVGDNHYQIYEDVEDSTCQNYEDIYGDESFSRTPSEVEATLIIKPTSSSADNNCAATHNLNDLEPNEVPEEMCQNEKELQLILPQLSDKQTQCPICNNHKKCHNILLDHIKYDHFGIKYYCEICKKNFNKENRHKSIHIKDRFPCEECGEAFTNKPQFLQHIMQKHGKNGSFKCECGETFASRRDLNSHKYMAHNKTSYKCHVCDQGFLRKDHLQSHLRRHAQGRKVRPKSKWVGRKTQTMIISPDDIPLIRERETSCPICTKRCRTNKKLLEHIKTDHLGEKYFCKICKKFYASELRHNNINHSRHWSKCKECDEKFRMKKDYTDHMRSVHNVTQETCPHICHCGKKFQLLDQIRKHKYRVHKETDFICQFCSKGFMKKSRLKEHVQMHTKDETFSCSQCFKMFYNRSSLAKHRLRMHRTGYVFVCDYCDKVFKSKSYLKSHITAHDPTNKPYACVVCGKRFRRSDHRNNHQALVHKLEKLNNM